MADKKKVIIELEVVDKQATAKLNGTTVAVDKLGDELQQTSQQARNLKTNLKGVTDTGGLAGATLQQVGGAVSDMNYGFRGVANNLSATVSLFGSLTTKAGGLGAAFKSLWRSVLGPAGLILAFQGVIALIERFSMETKEATEDTNELSRAILRLREAKEKLERTTNDEIELSVLQAKLEGKSAADIYKIKTEKQEEYLAFLEKNRKKLADEINRDITRYDKTPEELKNEIAERTALEKAVYKLKIQMQKDFLAEQLRIQQEAEGTGETPLTSGVSTLKPNTDLIDPSTDPEVVLAQGVADTLVDIQQRMNGRLSTLRNQQLDEEQRAYELRQRIAIMTAGLVSIVGQSMKEGSKEAARVQQIGALINAFASINEIWSKKGSSPFVAASIAEKVAATASVSAITFGNVKSIEQASKRLGGSSGGSNAPSRSFDFNIVGGDVNNTNAITSAINSQGQVVKAYVTTTDIKTATQLEDNLVNKATITDD